MQGRHLKTVDGFWGEKWLGPWKPAPKDYVPGGVDIWHVFIFNKDCPEEGEGVKVPVPVGAFLLNRHLETYRPLYYIDIRYEGLPKMYPEGE